MFENKVTKFAFWTGTVSISSTSTLLDIDIDYVSCLNNLKTNRYVTVLDFTEKDEFKLN